ncbi:MAG: hypothetical protein CSB16_03195 [Clostridiales bacterium]|nr:MAG: hypothetical protein CSB16_03195 [Clostridiales bacterium]
MKSIEEQYIEHYNMERIPLENTYLKKMVLSETIIDGNNALSAMIGLFSKEKGSLSYFHRLSVDEVWTFLDGDPIKLYLLNQDGSVETVVLSDKLEKGHFRMYHVKPGIWQAAETTGDFSIYTCNLSPAFSNDVFEGGDESLLDEYPDFRDIIKSRLPEGKFLPKDYEK